MYPLQLEKEKLVLEDQINVMRKLGANSTRFDLDDLVDAEDDLFEIELEEDDIQRFHFNTRTLIHGNVSYYDYMESIVNDYNVDEEFHVV